MVLFDPYVSREVGFGSEIRHADRFQRYTKLLFHQWMDKSQPVTLSPLAFNCSVLLQYSVHRLGNLRPRRDAITPSVYCSDRQ